MIRMATMTQSLEDYLEAIYVRIAGGKPAQVRDVARMLSVKMPSVVKAVRELKKMGLVTQEPYSNIELTVKGERMARHVLGRHTLIREFLMKLMEDNKDTEYGKRYHFDEVRSVEDYKRLVPLSGYDDYAPYIERMVDKREKNLITA